MERHGCLIWHICDNLLRYVVFHSFIRVLCFIVGLGLRQDTLSFRYVNWSLRFVHLSLRCVCLLFAYPG